VTNDPVTNVGVPVRHLEPQERAQRAGSFGEVASNYERYRPGPPLAAVRWILPTRVGTVVDLGAGTGQLTRLLLDRADVVYAVEPDDGMRSVLTDAIPGVRAIKGWGESLPIPDGSADAVVASSSWHWMDPVLALHEVGRVLQPDGLLGAVWSGPEPLGPMFLHAQTLVAKRDDEFTGVITRDAHRPTSKLQIPHGVQFDQPQHEVFRWHVALDADHLIGLLGTFSWIITLPDDTRESALAEARRLLRDALGIQGEVTIDIPFRADAWRSRHHDRA
jgi:SAM-dependent methyltransferase